MGRLFILRACMVGVLLAGMTRAAKSEVPSGITREQLVSGLIDLESALKAYSLNCVIKSELRSLQAPDRILPLTRRIELLSEVNGRFRFSQRGDVLRDGVPPQIQQAKHQGTFNGSELKQMMGDDTHFILGTISAERGDSHLIFDVSKFLTRYFDKSIAEWLNQRNGEIVEEFEFNGHKVVRVDTAPLENDGIEWKQSFVIDPEMGFATIRRAALKRLPTDEKWHEYTHVVTSDYVQNGQSGIWVPGSGVYESFTVTRLAMETGADEYPLTWRHRAEFTDWIINPPVSDGDFAFDFESGVFVTDKITGQSYAHRTVNDRGIAEIVAMAKLAQGNQWGGRTVLVLTNVLGLFFLGAWWYAASLRKRNAKPSP